MVKEIGGNATGVVPVLPKTEKSVGIPRSLRRGSQPFVPIHVVFPFCLGAGMRINGPVPLTLGGIAMIRTLTHDQLTDQSILDGLPRFPPLA